MVQNLLQFFGKENILETREIDSHQEEIARLIPSESLQIHIPLMILSDLGGHEKQENYALKDTFLLAFQLEVFDEDNFKLKYIELSRDVYHEGDFNAENLVKKMNLPSDANTSGASAFVHRQLELHYTYAHPTWVMEKNSLIYSTTYLGKTKETINREVEVNDIDIHSHMTIQNMLRTGHCGWRSEAAKITEPLYAFLSPNISFFVSYYLNLSADFYDPMFEFWHPRLYFSLVDHLKDQPNLFITITDFLKKGDPWVLSSIQEALDQYKRGAGSTLINYKYREEIMALEVPTYSNANYPNSPHHLTYLANLPEELVQYFEKQPWVELENDEEVEFQQERNNFRQPIYSEKSSYKIQLDSGHFFFRHTDEFYFRMLTCYKDFIREGELMQHCILSQWWKALQYEYTYLHINPVHKPHKKGYTAEIYFNAAGNKYELLQLVGPYNQMPPQKLITEVKRQIEERNKSLRQ